ncbi:hypothetical protein [Arthrobacter sp. EPSL27]|uniref:hypothetical protein n=1 Tax=Arthrobacter sp. EPSL27 TaxID=1745378 RepID=UPI00074B218D|nr:hypothetical protein [Arthrobacter sp. EPSL27]KUM37700.1 hypothetical protein AR539_10820 [Arthrobacter sp. EPSL27]
MQNLNDTERAFVVATLNRSRYFTAQPTYLGTRSVIVETRIGYHDATRYASLLSLNPPRKSGTRWRVRLKGPIAEALLGEFLPELTGRAREHADAALARIHADEPPRREAADLQSQ